LMRPWRIAPRESTCRLVVLGQHFLIRVDLNRARAAH
jgi:hypothetical protein